MLPGQLSSHDLKTVANLAGCSVRLVKYVLEGKRGGRNTLLQQRIKQLVEAKYRLNRLFEDFAQLFAFDRELRCTLWNEALEKLSGVPARFAFDRELRCTLWNEALEKLSGVPASLVLGKTRAEIWTNREWSQFDEHYRRALTGESVSIGPFQVTSVIEPGKISRVMLHVVPISDTGGQIVGGLVMVRVLIM